MSSLSELIERVEKASGQDRELDVAIILTLFPDAGPYQPYCKGDEPIFFNEPYRKQECPKLTSSIDAALTLLPEGWDSFRVERTGDTFGAFVGPFDTNASTPVLALLSAILRARLLDAASSEAADQ